MNTSNWTTDQMYTLLNESIRSGLTELLVLHLLEERDAYGYEIYKALTERTEGVFTFYHTAVYTYLRRMRMKGLIDVSENAPKELPTARHMVYYTITDEGRQYLKYGIAQFKQVHAQAAKFLGETL